MKRAPRASGNAVHRTLRTGHWGCTMYDRFICTLTTFPPTGGGDQPANKIWYVHPHRLAGVPERAPRRRPEDRLTSWEQFGPAFRVIQGMTCSAERHHESRQDGAVGLPCIDRTRRSTGRFCYMWHVARRPRTKPVPQSKSLALDDPPRLAPADLADDISQCCLCGWKKPAWCEETGLERRPRGTEGPGGRWFRPRRAGGPGLRTLGAPGRVLHGRGPGPRRRPTTAPDTGISAHGDPGIGRAAASLVKKLPAVRLMEAEDNGGLALYLLGYAEEAKRIGPFDAVACRGRESGGGLARPVLPLRAGQAARDRRGYPRHVRHIALLAEKTRAGPAFRGATGRTRTVVHDNDFLARLLPAPLLDEPGSRSANVGSSPACSGSGSSALGRQLAARGNPARGHRCLRRVENLGRF
jgi:hypothetical protein